MLKYTQELFGNDDAEFQRGTSKEEQLAALLDMFEYFTAVTASRRENPTEDLASAIANATYRRRAAVRYRDGVVLRDRRRPPATTPPAR